LEALRLVNPPSGEIRRRDGVLSVIGGVVVIKRNSSLKPGRIGCRGRGGVSGDGRGKRWFQTSLGQPGRWIGIMITRAGVTTILLGREGNGVAAIREEFTIGETVVVLVGVTAKWALVAAKKPMLLILSITCITHPDFESGMLVTFGNRSRRRGKPSISVARGTS
jgi:hypothetical protein